MNSLRQGLTSSEAHLRTSLFGSNVIEVASRGIIALLVDEVLHPFYIFQVASIALWMLDNYYCSLDEPAHRSTGAVHTDVSACVDRLRIRHCSHQYC